ncbi:MAG: hypothetical protein QNK05_22450 [Myxococcota bacterium]|nr:hypothetical protein [Myxococcota bacterium]
MSDAFERLCESLERATPLDRLAARGTVRIGLRHAGLDAQSVTPSQLRVVIDKVLPTELASRGVEWNDDLADRLATSQDGVEERDVDSPEAVFERLGSLGA